MPFISMLGLKERKSPSPVSNSAESIISTITTTTTARKDREPKARARNQIPEPMKLEKRDMKQARRHLPAVVGIFHDLENVNIPVPNCERTIPTLVRNLRNVLANDVLHCSQDLQVKAFRCYFDAEIAKPALRQALSNSGIDTIDVSHQVSGDKDAADRVMIVDTSFFYIDHLVEIDDNEAHKVVVLITADSDFLALARSLTERSVKVVLVLRSRSQPISPTMKEVAYRILYLSDLLQEAVPSKEKKATKKGMVVVASPIRTPSNLWRGHIWKKKEYPGYMAGMKSMMSAC